MIRLAIYAGTFDPITAGHFDIIERAAGIFDRLILAVVEKTEKQTMFTSEERLSMAKEVVGKMENVEIDSFGSLLVDYARKRDAKVLIRGLRAYSDFEYEFQMALTNRKLAPEIETLFMMPSEVHSYISSSIVREVALFGGDTNSFVPEAVQEHLARKLAEPDKSWVREVS